MLGLPTKHAVELVFAGNEYGGVAGAARREFVRDFAAGYFFGGVEDFEDGKAAAVADVESFAGDGFDGFEGAEMGIGDVQNVDVVADASAVGGRIVGAKDFELGNRAKGGVENFGDEVSFDAMGFAAQGGSASDIEIAEGGVMKAGVGAIVREDFLEAEFRFAVGIDGILRMVLGDGNSVRLAVSGGRRGKDEFPHAMASYGIEEIDAAGDVGGIKRAGLADGFGDERFAGEMHDGVDFVLGKDFLDLCTDTEIGFREDGAGRDGGGVAFLKIIEGDDFVAAGEENFRTNAADVACCSGDENVQGNDLSFFELIIVPGFRTATQIGQALKISGWRSVVSGGEGERAQNGATGWTCGAGR